MNFAEAIETGLKQIETVLGSKVFIYDTDEYKCHVGTQSKTTVLETGGFDETQQLVLCVRKSVFTDDVYPVENEKLTYNNVVYYIETINEDATGTFLNIALKV